MLTLLKMASRRSRHAAGATIAAEERMQVSGTILSGGVSQVVMPARTLGPFEMPGAKLVLILQNNSTGSLLFAFGEDASATNGIQVPAGQTYTWPKDDAPHDAISVWGATTGQTYFVSRADAVAGSPKGATA